MTSHSSSHSPLPDRNSMILIGASTRAFADCWRRAGFDCLCVDEYADADLSVWANVYGSIQELIASAEYATNPPVAWCYSGPMEYENLSELSQRLGLTCWGNNTTQVHQLRNFREQLSRSTSGIKPVCCLSTSQAAHHLKQGKQVVLKPNHSSAGAQTQWATLSRLNDWSDEDQQSLRLEPFLEGKVWGISCLGTPTGVEVLGICESVTISQWLGEDSIAFPFRYAGSIGPLVMSNGFMKQVHTLVDELFEQIGPIGLFGIDLVETQNELYLLEINPRFTSSMELLDLTGTKAIATAHAACFEANLPSQTLHSKIPALKPRWKRVVYTQQSIQWPSVDWNKVASELGGRCSLTQTDQPMVLADLPDAGSFSPPGAPVVTMYGYGPPSESHAMREAFCQAINLNGLL